MEMLCIMTMLVRLGTIHIYMVEMRGGKIAHMANAKLVLPGHIPTLANPNVGESQPQRIPQSNSPSGEYQPGES